MDGGRRAGPLLPRQRHASAAGRRELLVRSASENRDRRFGRVHVAGRELAHYEMVPSGREGCCYRHNYRRKADR